MIVEGRKTGKKAQHLRDWTPGQHSRFFAAVETSPIVVDSIGHDSFLEES